MIRFTFTRCLSEALSAWVLFFAAASASARVYERPLPRDYPTRIGVSVRRDAQSGLFEYRYTLANPASSPRALESVLLEFGEGVEAIFDVRSPRGWNSIYDKRRHRILWAATEVTVPQDYVDDGNILPGDFAIAPGSSLHGFSFWSSCAAGSGLAITQIYVPLPSADDDDELSGLPYESTVPEQSGYRARVLVPVAGAGGCR